MPFQVLVERVEVEVKQAEGKVFLGSFPVNGVGFVAAQSQSVTLNQVRTETETETETERRQKSPNKYIV